MRLIWRQKACHLVFLPLPCGWGCSLLLCSAWCCCVLCCAGILVERRAGALFALGYVQVLGPRRQLLRRGETSATAVLCWHGVVRGSGADTPVVSRTHRPPLSSCCFCISPLLPHTLSQDWTLHSLRGPNWALIRIWWWNSTPPAAEIPTCVIPNWTFGLSWLASKGWTL